MNNVHLHHNIKCGKCGCEYCTDCNNGCPQCGMGSKTIEYSSAAKDFTATFNPLNKQS